EGGAPYLLWREILRRLCLHTELNEFQTSVLKTLVPDIASLIEREVPDIPTIDLQSAQVRLLTVIEAVFRKQAQPIVLLLEDLQWAGESLTVLKRLNQVVHELPLLIVATYRDDERPDFPSQLTDMQFMKLQRLNNTAIADLSAAMLGESGRQAQIVDLLERETEGNIFFIVEVMRVLAEEAGQLDQVTVSSLPQKIVAGGMQAVVLRRLSRVPTAARPLLEIAAIAGRELDLAVLLATAVDTMTDSWLTICTDASILEVQDGRWRFAHDKLREGLLLNLSEVQRRNLHRDVATAIERVYADNAIQFAPLAYHWGEAGDLPKEAHYAGLAGKHALASSAYQEAVPLLTRALTLAPQIGASRDQQAELERWLGETYIALGRPGDTAEHARQALTLLGYHHPRSGLQLMTGLLNQVVQQIWHRIRLDLLNLVLPRTSRSDELVTAARASGNLGFTYYYANDRNNTLYYALKTLNLAEQAGTDGQFVQIQCYASMGVATGLIPLHRLAENYFRKADSLVPLVDDVEAVGWVPVARGTYQAGRARWDDAESQLTRALQIFEEIGHLRRWIEAATNLAIVYSQSGRWDESSRLFERLYSIARRNDDLQARAVGQAGL
ncbi:MAG TPA: tetratricopeptide repeat protein, partial [Phototrophicaceae bacterium]|nr:tetratricopeptide repeat protein [Phototrophicaceae bacterium]